MSERRMPQPWFRANTWNPPIGLDYDGDEPDRPLVSGERRLGRFILPPFQRPMVWTSKQQVRFIESVWSGLPIGNYVWNRSMGDPTDGWLLDGQQRWTALIAYHNNEFPVYGYRYYELSRPEQFGFNHTPFACLMTAMPTVAECRDVYDRLAYGGTPHEPRAAA